MIGSSMEKTSMKTVQDFPESATIQMQTLVLGDRNDAGKGSISSSMSKESTRSERESEVKSIDILYM